MSTATASIREIRTNFRAVKRKVEAHGEIVITDNGIPRFLLKPLDLPPRQRGVLPDYEARLKRQRVRPLSKQQTDELHKENRGNR